MATRRDIIVAVLIVGSIIVFGILLLVFVVSNFTGERVEFSGFGDRIAVIDLHGEIVDSRNFVRQLKKYSDMSNVPAILVDINSPGGAVVPSMEIHEEILKTRHKGTIIVASFGSVAASGAYMVACACDTIVSSPGTITGSIGTILSFPVAKELMDKIGLKYEVIKSGEYKDVGNFARSVTKDERQMLQNLINNSYGQFVKIVSESRSIPEEQVRRLAQGQVYTGKQALELGLVDTLGDYYDALDIAAKMAGIEGEPKTIKEYERRPSFLDVIADGVSRLSEIASSQHKNPQLEYIFQ